MDKEESVWGDDPFKGFDELFKKTDRDKRRDEAAERLGAALKEAYELNQENKEFTILELLAYLLEEERKKKIESGEIQPPYLKNFKPFK